jgi:low affinity Fe/Cu permease
MDRIVNGATKWLGSTASVIVHTVFFAACFVLVLLGFSFEKVLLTLTTAVSLEAIYLALFIQMSVNRTTESLEAVEEDLAEIEEDVQEIHEDVAEIEKDIDEIQEDIDEIEKDEDEQRARDVADAASLKLIEERLTRILADLEKIRR